MTRHRLTTLFASAIVLATTMVACAPSTEPDESPSPSATTPTEAPVDTESPVETDAPGRFDLPVNCLSVVTPEYRTTLLGAAATVQFVSGRIGPLPNSGGIDGITDVAETRSAACWFAIASGTEELRYVEFAATSTQEVLDDLQAWGDAGESNHPPGTDLALEPVDGLSEAQQLVIPSSDGLVKTFIVGEGWYLYVSSRLGVDDLAAPVPDARYDGAAFTSDFPADQRCEAMLPTPTPALDLFASLELHSGDSICYSALDDDDYAADLWWEASEPAASAQILADAEDGVGGLDLGGSTIDGDGMLVTTDGVEVLVVFDDAIVHVVLPDGMEQGVQTARYVHAPGWQDVLSAT